MARKAYDTDGKDRKDAKQLPLLGGYDAQFRGYINLNLTDAQKDAYTAWSVTDALWVQFEAFVSDGVNLSVKWLPKDNCFIASATQRREASPNAGLVVTARGLSAAVAFGRVIYILTILSHEERWEDVQPIAGRDRW